MSWEPPDPNDPNPAGPGNGGPEPAIRKLVIDALASSDPREHRRVLEEILTLLPILFPGPDGPRIHV